MSDQPPLFLQGCMVDFYRQMMRDHTSDPELGACRICGTRRCYEWLHAYTVLVMAGELEMPPLRRPDTS